MPEQTLNPAYDRAPGVGILLGLLGAPIRHSASPAMHEAAARRLGLRCYYHLIDVAGAGRPELSAMLEGVRRLGFAGINVTFPYKEAVLPLLDELSPDAAAIGAVNTIVVDSGRLIGRNTDATGFARAQAETIGGALDGPIAILGAGGVGKAIGFALAELGAAELRIFDTDPGKAASLAAALRGRTDARVCASAVEAARGAAGLINGTPIGMLPNRESPVPAEILHEGMWVADAVYNPLWTPLLRDASSRGARVMTGRELAIYQAMDAFKHFTGRDPARDAMSAAFDGVMQAGAAA